MIFWRSPISGVRKHSPAYRHGIQAGERLLTLNGNEIMDVLDYRFYQLNTALVLELEKQPGRTPYGFFEKAGI